jgi:hypothetical protein
MTLRDLLIKALQILALAAFIGAVLWVNGTDRQVQQAALEDYCHAVAVWSAEEARGIAPTRRTGHPDYDERAAEDCPGLRPAGQAVAGNSSETLTRSTERQLARQ